MRHPSQNTADFLPLPRLRGRNWRARWQRINRAMDRLETLPPVELVQVGDDYYVADGHNRVAAARQAGAVDIDADVTQLLLPGVTQPGQAMIDASSLVGAAELRQAAAGRQSRTVEQRDAADAVSRQRPAATWTTSAGDGPPAAALAGSGAVRRPRWPADPDPRRLRRARPVARLAGHARAASGRST